MKIAVPSLPQGKHTFETVSPPSEYGELAARSGLRFSGRIGVRAIVSKMGEDLFVHADVSAPVKAECARCLHEFELPLATVFEALYVPDRGEDSVTSAAHRVQRESQRIQYYTGGVADLGEQIIEALLLAAPMKPLCRPDCKGICPGCGKNLNEETCGCKRPGGFSSPFKDLLGR